MTGQRAHTRETAASVAQYVLLGGFAAVAAGISAQGLTGFARSNMELTGAWPYLLFLALDGAAGVCAVLLVRRAARAESGLAPRLAVWGLVAASSTFNWTHAPRRPAAAEAFGLMPVIAALLFEFCLRELRQRTMTDRADRKLSTLRWLHPAERVRVQLRMAADEQLSAEAATRHVRVDHAASRLYQLRAALDAHGQSDAHSALAARRIRRAEHRAHGALTRAGFADPAIAVAVLRQVQVLTMTAALARLDYHTADAAQAAIANLIASPAAAKPGPDTGARTGHPIAQDGTAGMTAPPDRTSVNQINGHPAIDSCATSIDRRPRCPACRSRHPHRRRGRARGLSPQPGRPCRQLRREGYTVANNRLRWLSSVSGLEPRHATEPDRQPRAGP